MRKHNIKFDILPRSVTLVPMFRPPQPVAEMPAASRQRSEKLTTTAAPEVAKSDDSHAEMQKLILKISQDIEQLKHHHDQTLPQIQEFAVRLAMQIARAVVMHDVTCHDDRIRATLNSYLQQYEPEHPVVVYLNKKDLDRLLNSSPDSPSLNSVFELKPDESIALGDCRIETTNQIVIASCVRQLDEIQLQLMENLDHARSERGASA